MRRPETFWERKKLQLDRSWAAFRRGGSEAAPELGATLKRIAAAARAARDPKLARQAKRIARRLAPLETFESHRRLLARVRRKGFLAPEAAAGLDPRWEELARDRSERILSKTRGRPMRKLRRALSRRAKARKDDVVRALERARRRLAQRLDPPAPDADDRDLRRFHASVRKARDLALLLSDAGKPGPAAALEREARVADALDRWRELRAFRGALERERQEAEVRGSVTLALGLDRLISALDQSLAKARREALKSARAASNVVAFQRRTA